MARATAAAGLIYAVLTAVMGRLVIGAGGSAIASDPGDPLLNAAILAWNAQHVPATSAWYQFPIFHPTADTLAFSEHLLGVSVIASPIYWITGSAAIAYNVTLLLSYPLCGLAMFALVWRLTRHLESGDGSSHREARVAAAFLAGLAFAFAPYRASHLPHIQVLTVFWAPLALLALHGFLDSAGPPAAEPALQSSNRGRLLAGVRGGWRELARTRPFWLALLAACWVLQGAANGYFLVYFTLLVGLWLLWFLVADRRWRESALVAAALGVAALPLAPILYRYLVAQRAQGLARNLGEIASFGADIAAPLCAPPALTFWGWLRIACGSEGELFPGAGLIALSCVAWFWLIREVHRDGQGAQREPVYSGGRVGSGVRTGVRRLVRRAALAAALAYFAIALATVVVGPWRFDLGWLRASASSADKPLSVALLMCLVAFVLSGRFARIVQQRSTRGFYLGAATVCWVFSWGPFPRFFGAEALYQAPYAWLLPLPGVAALRVPARFWMMTVICLIVFMGLTLAEALARRTRRALVTIVAVAGCALLADGWTTIPAAPVPAAAADPSSLRDANVMLLPLGTFERDVPASYRAVTEGWRSINGYSGYEPGYYEALRTLSQARDPVMFEPFLSRGDVHVVVEQGDDATLSLVTGQPGAQLTARAPGLVQYRVPGRPAPPRSVPPLANRIAIAGLTASCSQEGVGFAIDGNAETSWVCGTQTADQQITADLGRVSPVGAIVHELGALGADFPRHLIVETSVDGVSWETAWQGSPAAEVLRAAMAAPRLTRVVLPFPPRPAQYVRLRQTGRHERGYWSIAEFEAWSGAS